jgi:hypothetical protein
MRRAILLEIDRLHLRERSEQEISKLNKFQGMGIVHQSRDLIAGLS